MFIGCLYQRDLILQGWHLLQNHSLIHLLNHSNTSLTSMTPFDIHENTMNTFSTIFSQFLLGLIIPSPEQKTTLFDLSPPHGMRNPLFVVLFFFHACNSVVTSKATWPFPPFCFTFKF